MSACWQPHLRRTIPEISGDTEINTSRSSNTFACLSVEWKLIRVIWQGYVGCMHGEMGFLVTKTQKSLLWMDLPQNFTALKLFSQLNWIYAAQRQDLTHQQYDATYKISELLHFFCDFFIAAWEKLLPKLRYFENSLAASKLLKIKAKLLAWLLLFHFSTTLTMIVFHTLVSTLYV